MRKLTMVVASSLLMAGAAQASPNLVSNGDFFAGGTDWTLTDSSSSSNFTSGAGCADVNAATRPNCFVGGATGVVGTLSQTVSGLTGGSSYQVSFELANTFGNTPPNSFTATFDGNPVYYLGPSSGQPDPDTNFGWTVVSRVRTAATGSADLVFSFQNDTGNYLLTNVSVTAVPEPGTYALLLAGMAVMATAARRRRAV